MPVTMYIPEYNQGCVLLDEAPSTGRMFLPIVAGRVFYTTMLDMLDN